MTNAVYLASLVNSSGNNVTLQGGVVGSGTGVAFPATQVASSDANTLDDYEEGSWTPTLFGAGGSAGALAYSSRSAKYTKIGNMVILTGYVGLTNKGSYTGQAIIGGFPFTVLNDGGAYGGISCYFTGMSYPAGGSGGGIYPFPNTTTGYLYYNSGTAGVLTTDYSYLNNNSQVGAFTIVYPTN